MDRSMSEMLGENWSANLRRGAGRLERGGRGGEEVNRKIYWLWVWLSVFFETIGSKNDYYWIGRAYQLSLQISTAQKWLQDGLTIAQQTIEANPEDAIALSYVGLFHSRLGNFSDGETAMNKAIQINNNSAEIFLGIIATAESVK